MLEIYRLDVDAIETYARKFRRDGITQEQMEDLLAAAGEGLARTETTTDKTEGIKKAVTGRLDEAAEAVTRAFTDSRVPDSERY